jgi:hypothetical protein
VSVAYLRLIILSVVCDILVDSEILFDRLRESQDQTNPVDVHRGRIYIRVFIKISARICTGRNDP